MNAPVNQKFLAEKAREGQATPEINEHEAMCLDEIYAGLRPTSSQRLSEALKRGCVRSAVEAPIDEEGEVVQTYRLTPYGHCLLGDYRRRRFQEKRSKKR